MKTLVSLRYCKLLVSILIVCFLGAFSSPAFAEGTLTVISPPSGTIVNPGDTISVAVQVNTPTDFTEIMLQSELFGALGLSAAQPSAALTQFVVHIPLHQPRRNLYISAIAKSVSSGLLVNSPAGWVVDVEDGVASPVRGIVVEPEDLWLRIG